MPYSLLSGCPVPDPGLDRFTKNKYTQNAEVEKLLLITSGITIEQTRQDFNQHDWNKLKPRKQ